MTVNVCPKCGREDRDPIRHSYHVLACNPPPKPVEQPDTLSDADAEKVYNRIMEDMQTLKGNRAWMRKLMNQFVAR